MLLSQNRSLIKRENSWKNLSWIHGDHIGYLEGLQGDILKVLKVYLEGLQGHLVETFGLFSS